MPVDRQDAETLFPVFSDLFISRIYMTKFNESDKHHSSDDIADGWPDLYIKIVLPVDRFAG